MSEAAIEPLDFGGSLERVLVVGREDGCEREDVSGVASGSGVVVAAVDAGLVAGGASGLLLVGCCVGAGHFGDHVALRAGACGAFHPAVEVNADPRMMLTLLIFKRDGDSFFAEDHSAV